MFLLIGGLALLFLITLLLLPAVVKTTPTDSRSSAFLRPGTKAGERATAPVDSMTGEEPALEKTAREFHDTGHMTLPAIHFRPNEATIHYPSETLLAHLDLVSQRLREDSSKLTKIRITGHTDRQGSRDHNLALSLARAQAICDLLTTQSGVESDQTRAIGRGFSEPIADNSTSEGRQKNRRVEIDMNIEVESETASPPER